MRTPIKLGVRGSGKVGIRFVWDLLRTRMNQQEARAVILRAIAKYGVIMWDGGMRDDVLALMQASHEIPRDPELLFWEACDIAYQVRK